MSETVEVVPRELAVFGLWGWDPVGAWIARVTFQTALGECLALWGGGPGTFRGAGTGNVEGSWDEVEDA